MHTFPDNNVGLLWIYDVFGYGIRDPQIEIPRVETTRTDNSGVVATPTAAVAGTSGSTPGEPPCGTLLRRWL